MLETINTEVDSRVTVTLLGKEYALKGDIEPEQMIRISKYVNNRFFELKKKTPDIDVTNLLLLTALNLTDELLRARQSDEIMNKRESDKMFKKTEKLIQMLENGLIGEEEFCYN